jgi:hypothetical protein
MKSMRVLKRWQRESSDSATSQGSDTATSLGSTARCCSSSLELMCHAYSWTLKNQVSSIQVSIEYMFYFSRVNSKKPPYYSANFAKQSEKKLKSQKSTMLALVASNVHCLANFAQLTTSLIPGPHESVMTWHGGGAPVRAGVCYRCLMGGTHLSVILSGPDRA